MTERMLLAATLACALLAAGCATPLGDAAALSEKAIITAAALAPPATGSLTTESEAQTTTTVPYNLGIKVRTAERQTTRTLPNRLKETILRGRTETGSGTIEGSSRLVTLCGLVPLIMESGSPGNAGMLVFTGKAGTVFPVGATPPTTTREITTELETSSPDLCSPKPGMSVSFKTSSKFEINIPPFRRVVDLTETYRCDISERFERHAELKSAGATLFATCAISGAGLDRPNQKQYVFFPAFNEYHTVYVRYSDSHYQEFNFTTQPRQVMN